jgi:hypothetical protein
MVSETGPSSFAGHGPTEQTVRFDKPEHPNFAETQIFLDLIENLVLAMPSRSPLYFHPWKHARQ